MLHNPCNLGDTQIKIDKMRTGPQLDGNATSPLHSRGSPNKGGQNQNWPTSGRKCYITPAFSGIPKKRGTKSELAHKWAEMLPHPCILGDPRKKGDRSQSSTVSSCPPAPSSMGEIDTNRPRARMDRPPRQRIRVLPIKWGRQLIRHCQPRTTDADRTRYPHQNIAHPPLHLTPDPAGPRHTGERRVLGAGFHQVRSPRVTMPVHSLSDRVW